jgi:hypothetical protein
MGRVHLDGDFGTHRDAVDADFPYFGETIRVHPDASDLHFAELMIVANGIDVGDIDMDDPASWTAEQRVAVAKANDATIHAIQGQIHPDDWDRFFKTAQANRQRTMDLMELSKKITEAVAGFPTGQPSGSAVGRPPTKRKSRADSSARRALKMLEGRPDLQMAVVKAHEAQAEAG